MWGAGDTPQERAGGGPSTGPGAAWPGRGASSSHLLPPNERRRNGHCFRGADACSDRAGTGPSCSRSQPAVDRTEDSATGSSLEAEVIERDEQLLAVERTLGVPWRNCPNSETTALKNPCLDSLSNFSDTLSLVDTIAVRSRDSHVTRLSDAWWKCELETGLLDELPLGGCGDCWKAEVVCTSEEIVGVAEGLAMGGVGEG